jgi:integrase
MARLSKRFVDQAENASTDYFIWDDELSGFGLRVFASGKRSYLVQYRAGGRTRRFTIGAHGVWTPETARKEARILLGQISQGENPAEQKQLDTKAITVKELCTRYLADCHAGLVPGKGGRPKKPSTLATDESRIKRHILPLMGNRRVRDLTQADITKFLRDVASGKTRADMKTRKHGRAIVRGGIGTGSRGVGLLGGIFTYAIREGMIDKNPVHGFQKPKDRVRDRRLTEREYRLLGKLLDNAADNLQFAMTAKIVRAIAMTGCRRGEVIHLKSGEVDAERSCIRLEDSKEGASIRAIGLPVVELLEPLLTLNDEAAFVFPGTEVGKPLVGLPKLWEKLIKNTPLEGITLHVLRHSFASVANDLGFTESTIAALVGHSRGTITSRYIHTVDTALVMAADTVASYIQALLDAVKFKRTNYAIDRDARRAAMHRYLTQNLEADRPIERLAA